MAIAEEEVDVGALSDEDLERTPLGRAFLRLRADHDALRADHDSRLARIEMAMLSAGAALTIGADARDDY